MSDGIFGLCYICLSIMFGAFFTHGLEDSLSPNKLNSLHVAARYLFYCGLLVLLQFFSKKKWQWPRTLPVLMIISGGLFSFSIILLVWKGWRWLGPLTPIGGVGLIISCIYWGYLIRTSHNDS